jgi:CheY-like chemotaxis protein
VAGINSNEFMDELHFCIKERDIVKAKALLQFASDSNIDVSIQQKALSALGQAPESLAFPLLEHLLRIEITSPEINEALYELILEKSYGRTDLVVGYIHHEHKKSRLVFIQAAGDLMLLDAAPDLAKMLDSKDEADQDRELLIAATKALGVMRLESYLSVLAKVRTNPDPAIARAAIFAIAEMGTKAAVETLFSTITVSEKSTGTEIETNLVAIEALAAIQDQYALDYLVQLLGSSHADIRDAAIDQLTAIGNKAVPTLTAAARDAKDDFMVHLVTTLGYIGDQSALPLLIDLVNVQPKDANIRQALYESLERIPSAKSAICLAGGLSDKVEAVRMSAARAVDKNLSKVLVAGLKNIVREEDETALSAVAALIDAEADNIFNFLLDEEPFIRLTTEHIKNRADSATKKHFLDLLRSKNRWDIADTLEAKIEKDVPKTKDQTNTETVKKTVPKIYVVDDSKMMLKLYQNKLIKFGYHPTTFEFPEKAITAISIEKPDILITDLNMPKINGIQLTKQLRRKYTLKELPIIMITTQSDFVDMNRDSNQSIINSDYLAQTGINTLLHKPFSDEQLITAIQALIE